VPVDDRVHCGALVIRGGQLGRRGTYTGRSMKEIRLLTVDQVAHLCQVSIRTVYRAISRGSLRASHLGRGGAYRIRPEDVEAWVNRTAVGTSGRDAEARSPGTLIVPENTDPDG